VPAEYVRPSPSELAGGLLPFGGLLRAFQMVGAMRRALDLSIQYAGERQQFGKPIGKFQAVQQMLADAAGQIAAAEAACARAAAAWDGVDCAFFAGVAKARAGEAAGKVAEICHQAHGAIGFTQEHSLHFATRRLWSWRDEYGNETYWQSLIGQAVCSAGNADLWPRLAPLS
jgi:acyl-CoA dehydrogenase